ncbi:hypothetical protein J2X69_002651 [Algoriphagus sp. 4150]|uniref:hypothetical protein n=1 Tax=Algoriphagus sp. 4150 TaxID=2817756 RepID=UPI002863BB81
MVDAGIYNHAPVCRAPVMDISSVYILIFNGQMESRTANNHPSPEASSGQVVCRLRHARFHVIII